MRAISSTKNSRRTRSLPLIYILVPELRKNPNGKNLWKMTSTNYNKVEIENLEVQLKKRGYSLPKRDKTPISGDYSPETDDSPKLDKKGVTSFQEFIGLLRWAI